MNPNRLWDIYETETLAVRRSLDSDTIRAELRQGTISGQDLIRPAGSEIPWRRIAELAPGELAAPERKPPAPTRHDRHEPAQIGDQDLLDPDAEIEPDPDSGEDIAPAARKPERGSESSPPEKAGLPSIELQALQWLMEDDEPSAKPKVEAARRPPQEVARKPERTGKITPEAGILEPSVELKLEPAEPIAPHLSFDDLDEDEDDFTLSRSRVEHVEEMDLAAMVDIAFQLVLFFMVTASVTMIKSMELPKPTETTKPAAASAPGVGTRDRSELETEFIVVKISTDGEILVEDEPVAADRLIDRLRTVRNESGKTGMLLRAENRTKHRMAVAAYDAANEIGLRIAIERETSAP